MEELLAIHLTEAGIPFEREFRFAVTRKWRADFFIEPDLLVEIQGGTWMAGRHSRGTGYEADCRKANYATLLGYRVLRVTSAMVNSGEAKRLIERAVREGLGVDA